ncbi:MAG: hypothetical protein ACT4OF_09015 [Caulobacteraceae bacterium]
MRRVEALLAEPVTLGAALKELGWFWGLFAFALGAPSLLSIFQMVFLEHRLIEALQEIVDAYNRMLAYLSAYIEPLLHQLIAWMFTVPVELHAHWRPLFVLMMLHETADARNMWRFGAQAAAIARWLPGSIGAFIGAFLAGLAPLDGPWWAQGLIVAAPLAGPTVIRGLLAMGQQSFLPMAFVTLLTFAIGAAVSFIPGLPRGAGILVMALLLLFNAITTFTRGLAKREFGRLPDGTLVSGKAIRMRSLSDLWFSLALLGGFLAAALILVADYVLKALGYQ